MAENKKKLLIIIAAILIFAMLAAGALALQSSSLSSESITSSSESSETSLSKPEDEKSEESDSSLSSSENKSSEAETSGSKTETPPESSGKPSKETVSKPASSAESFSESKVSSSSSSEAKPPEEKKEQVTVTFYDDVNGKQILTGSVSLKEGATAADVSALLLKENGVKYSTTGSGATFYFSMIAGLRERGAGPMSGWIFFVKHAEESDFVRSTVGSGSTVLKDGDSILWQYLEKY